MTSVLISRRSEAYVSSVIIPASEMKKLTEEGLREMATNDHASELDFGLDGTVTVFFGAADRETSDANREGFTQAVFMEMGRA